jgi:hypothetical protein
MSTIAAISLATAITFVFFVFLIRHALYAEADRRRADDLYPPLAHPTPGDIRLDYELAAKRVTDMFNQSDL